MPAAPAPAAETTRPAARAAWSLRGRMLAIALGVALLAWLVGGLAFYLVDSRIDGERRDARLMHLADTLAAFAEHELAEVASTVDGPTSTAAEGHVERASTLDVRYLYQIWRRGGRLVMRSHDAPADRALAPGREPGLADAVIGGQPMRTYRLLAGLGTLEVQVAERQEARSALASAMGTSLLAAMLLSLLAVALLAGWLVVRALRPVDALAQRLAQRQPLDDAALQVADVPAEMQPMLAALNSLLARIGERLSRERGFTALAAHELRTPLAALRLQAQVAQREPDPERRQQQLAALTRIADRCDHLLSQLLTLARLEQDDPSAPPEALDLEALVDEVLDDLAPLAQRHGTQLDVDLQARQLHGRPYALQMLLRNLVENALLHTPPGGTVRVASRHEGGATLLDIDDSGPGIPAADRTRVFQRFVRLSPQTGQPGAGLGLSIVRSVAEAHHASVALLDAPGGGLRVRLSFPDAPGPAGSPGHAP